jgi:diguanylate cyclase (GGDEF)-like protein
VIEPYYRAALRGAEGSFEMPYRGRIFLVRVLPVRGAGGEVECGMVMTQDVTQERRDRQALQALADQDDLTGLSNRRRFHEELAHRHALGQRYGENTAQGFDVDRFKEINDTRGHAAGDEALRGIAAVLRARLRRTDIPARVGGDEFAVLLPHTEAEAAAALAASLVEALRWPGGSAAPAFTVSIGVGELERGGSPQDAVRAADAAMYEAKRAGGDRWAAARTGAQARTGARA